MLPQGIFSVAVAAVLFPTLSRYAAAGDLGTFARTVASGLRQIAFLLIPASVTCAVLAEPMVRLFYQHGSFDSSDTHTVAMALVGFSVGLAFNGAMLLLIRSFFSLQMTWTPTIIALANLFVNAILDAVLYRFGVWGIPLSTSIVNMLGVAALVWYLRRVVGSLDGHRTVRLAVRVLVASAFLGVVAFCTWSVLDKQLGQSLPAQLVSLGGGLALGGATYLSLCSLMRVEELDVLTALIHR
jgi:putative peptidoglycan lipid II flippase